MYCHHDQTGHGIGTGHTHAIARLPWIAGRAPVYVFDQLARVCLTQLCQQPRTLQAPGSYICIGRLTCRVLQKSHRCREAGVERPRRQVEARAQPCHRLLVLRAGRHCWLGELRVLVQPPSSRRHLRQPQQLQSSQRQRPLCTVRRP